MARVHYTKHSFRAPGKYVSRPDGKREVKDYRNAFMKDRDRILYSTAFRRLAGKTQIYRMGINDHMRTRLTHTLEVSQIAKTIAEYLKLDVSLTEAIALGHDIGHTPFGHAGESMLHKLATLEKRPDNDMPERKVDQEGKTLETDPLYNQYGFKHNWQSAAVSLNEETYNSHGLNLTNYTLYGMVYHTSPFFKKDSPTSKLLGAYEGIREYMKLKGSDVDAWSFESFVVNQADEIAQRHHDLEDAILGKLLTQEKICDDINKYFNTFMDRQGVSSKKAFAELKKEKDPDRFASRLSEFMLNLLMSRLINVSADNLEWFWSQKIKSNGITFDEYMKHSQEDLESGWLSKIISFDPISNETDHAFGNAVDALETLITEHVIVSHPVHLMNAQGSNIITKIFHSYYHTPTQLPNHCVKEYMLACAEAKEKAVIIKSIEKEGIGPLRKKFEKEMEEIKKKNIGGKMDETQQMNIEKKKMILIRTICNHISGMTDAYAQKVYKDLY